MVSPCNMKHVFLSMSHSSLLLKIVWNLSSLSNYYSFYFSKLSTLVERIMTQQRYLKVGLIMMQLPETFFQSLNIFYFYSNNHNTMIYLIFCWFRIRNILEHDSLISLKEVFILCKQRLKRKNTFQNDWLWMV